MSTRRLWAVIDTETTGLRSPWLPGGRATWEIVILTADVEPYHVRLDLTASEVRHADERALQLTRWHERSAVEAEDFLPVTDRPQVAREVARLLEGRVIVGVNPDFDAENLAALLHSHFVEGLWHYHTLDVTALGAYATDLPLDSRSEDVALALGVNRADYQPSHTADADARWALAQWEAIQRLGQP